MILAMGVKQFCFPNFSKRTGQTKTFKSELPVIATKNMRQYR